MKRFFSVLCTLLLCIPAFFAVMAETADDLFSDKDLTLADPSEAVDIVLTEGGVDITEPGVYRLSGQVADGSIRVAPATEGDVWLLLDGVSVHNEDGAALTSDGCDKLILTLAEGSVNSLTQGSATPAFWLSPLRASNSPSRPMTGRPLPYRAMNAVGISATPRVTAKPSFSR